MKYINFLILSVIFLFSLPLLTHAQDAPKLKGAWELVSQKIDGVNSLISGRQIKLLTDNYFAWIRQDKDKNIELLKKGTLRDSLAAFHDLFGAGKYIVNGNKYTETSEFFYQPEYVNTSIEFEYKLDGNTWYIAGRYAHSSNGQPAKEILLEQVWKRID